MNAWVPPRVVRRAVVGPLWLPLAAVLGVVAVVAGAAGLLVAPVSGPRRLARVSGLALVYLYVDVSLLLGSFAAWLRRPRWRRDEGEWRAAHCRLLARALGTFLRAAERLTGFAVSLEAGCVPPPGGRPLIVLARHGGPGDSFALVDLLLSELGRRPRVVLKRALQWDPGLDVVLTRLSGCFLPSRSGAGDDRRDALAALAADLAPADALLLFPEGGNWTPRRQRRAVLRLLRAGRGRAAREARARDAVLPPRPAGTVACLQARPDADVLVVAHAGLDTLVTPGQLWRAVPVHGRPMRVSWWLCPAATVPRDEAGAEQWLRRQWDEVDARVTTLRG